MASCGSRGAMSGADPSTGWVEPSIIYGGWREGRKVMPLRCYGERHPHGLAVAPTGWGKTYQTFLPTLAGSWTGSAIIYDTKGELWHRTAGFRSTFSRCILVEPAAATSARRNALTSIRGEGVTGGMRFAIMDSQNTSGLLPYEDDEFAGEKIWDTTAKDYASAAILWVLSFAPPVDKNLAGVARCVAQGRAFGLAMIENPHRDAEVRRVITAAAAALWTNGSDRYVGSILGTLGSYLVPYREPILAANTAESDFTPSDLMCGRWPVSLYVHVPLPHQRRLRPAMRMLFSQVIAELMEFEHSDRDGLAKRHPLLWALD